MAVFMLDTDAVTSGISNLESLFARLQDVEDSVNGYDTACSDGFDFATAKNSICTNIRTCYEKVKATYDLIDNVVSSHVSLQSSLKFEDTSEKKKLASGSSKSGANTNDSKDANVSANSKVSTPSSSASGGGSGASTGFRTTGSSSSSSLGGGSGSTFSSGSSTIGGVASAGMIGAAAVGSSSKNLSSSGSGSTVSNGSTSASSRSNGSNSSTNKSSSKNSTTAWKNVGNDTYTNSASKNIEVTDSVTKVDYYEFDRTNFNNYKSNITKSFNFREDGFITVNNRNAISCDKSVGNVGDIISITGSDGSQIECIVVENVSKSKGINFYVDKSNFSMNKNNNLADIILGDKAKIVNIGQDRNFQIQYALQTIDSDIEILN